MLYLSITLIIEIAFFLPLDIFFLFFILFILCIQHKGFREHLPSSLYFYNFHCILSYVAWLYIYDKPSLQRDREDSHFLMRETQKWYSCCNPI